MVSVIDDLTEWIRHQEITQRDIPTYIIEIKSKFG